jgi:hypothetical protein
MRDSEKGEDFTFSQCVLWQPGLVSELPPSNKHTNWSLLRAKMALLFNNKSFIYQSKQNSAWEESTVLFLRVESHRPRDWCLRTREPGEPSLVGDALSAASSATSLATARGTGRIDAVGFSGPGGGPYVYAGDLLGAGDIR